jgi:hypothetical protein
MAEIREDDHGGRTEFVSKVQLEKELLEFHRLVAIRKFIRFSVKKFSFFARLNISRRL